MVERGWIVPPREAGQGPEVRGPLLRGNPGRLERGVHVGLVGEARDDHARAARVFRNDSRRVPKS